MGKTCNKNKKCSWNEGYPPASYDYFSAESELMLNENFFANVDGASVVDMISEIEMDSNLLIVLAVMFAVVFLFAVRQCLVSGKMKSMRRLQMIRIVMLKELV